MESYAVETYRDRIAKIYGELYPALPEDDPIVTLLQDLVGKGPALERGVGTGRVALPLARRGLDVHWIDSSPAMVAKLRAKPGGDQVRVTLGDFTRIPTEDRYPLVFVVFNTFFALPTQEDQVRCFASVTEHLSEGGRFLIGALVPDMTLFDKGQRTSTTCVGLDWVQIDATRHERAAQIVLSH